MKLTNTSKQQIINAIGIQRIEARDAQGNTIATLEKNESGDFAGSVAADGIASYIAITDYGEFPIEVSFGAGSGEFNAGDSIFLPGIKLMEG